MGELFNIAIVVEGQLSGSDRRHLTDHVLTVAFSWIGQPYAIAANDTGLGEVSERPWTDALPGLPEILAPAVLIHIYTGSAGRREGIVTIEQGTNLTLITVSIPVSGLSNHSFERVEDLVIDLYNSASAGHRAAVFAGSELGVNSGSSTIAQAVEDATTDLSVLTFVVAPGDVLPLHLPSVLIAETGDSHTIVRHRYARERAKRSL